MKKSTFAMVTVGALLLGDSALGETIYTSPKVLNDRSLYEKLLYNFTVDNTGEGNLTWASTTALRDGGPIRIYFQSGQWLAGYSTCFRWDTLDSAGNWGKRYFCADWFDKTQHSKEIFSAAEAGRIKTFSIENFDVEGTGAGWNGVGRPHGTLAHERRWFSLDNRRETAPIVSTSSEDRALLAVAMCGLQFLGEEACVNEVEKELGRSIGGLTCAAFLQQAFGGQVDPAELAVGALADAASSSEDGFWQIVGGLTKLALFANCVENSQ